MNPVREFFAAIGDGISKAAEQLCPMDHTAARRAQAVLDAADALADAEAEIDAWEPSCGHPNHGNADHCCRPFLPCDGGCCKPVEDRPPTNYLTGVCACGAGYATAAECPWCSPQPADDEPRVVGMQHADSSEEVGGPESPSPERPGSRTRLFKCGSPSCLCVDDDRYEPVNGTAVAPPAPEEPLFAATADSDLLRAAAITLRYFVECAGGTTPNTERLIAELTDRAAQFEALERTFATNSEK